jgi:hypothetical protein
MELLIKFPILSVMSNRYIVAYLWRRNGKDQKQKKQQ